MFGGLLREGFPKLRLGTTFCNELQYLILDKNYTYMKTLFFALMLVTYFAYGQKYEYINLTHVKAGIGAKVEFNWPSQIDSARIYTEMKSKSLLLCVQTMESKGFELVTINEYSPGNLVMITTAYMRRRK